MPPRICPTSRGGGPGQQSPSKMALPQKATTILWWWVRGGTYVLRRETEGEVEGKAEGERLGQGGMCVTNGVAGQHPRTNNRIVASRSPLL